jgi:hypothetical protein
MARPQIILRESWCRHVTHRLTAATAQEMEGQPTLGESRQDRDHVPAMPVPMRAESARSTGRASRGQVVIRA